MRVLVAFDKFKGALSAREAGEVVARALRRLLKQWSFDLCPLTDGGDGFAEILTAAASGTLHSVRVAGPRGKRVTAKYGLARIDHIPRAARSMLDLPDLPGSARIAIVEMAQASGLALLEADLRDPWQASTGGTGQVIRCAVDQGAQGVLLGVGGSATHDLGLGALSVLGVKFLRLDDSVLSSLEPARWMQIARITGAGRASIPPIRIACDVTNPLLGPRGAAKIYAPQKGLGPRDYRRLEQETSRISAMLCNYYDQPISLRHVPGAGAAGGLAFGLICALRSRLLPGSDLVSAWLGLKRRLAAADLVITGEGRFDKSSYNGKGPGSVAKSALKLGKPVHVFAGQATTMPFQLGLKVHIITPPGQELAEALRATVRNLETAARRVFA